MISYDNEFIDEQPSLTVQL